MYDITFYYYYLLFIFCSYFFYRTNIIINLFIYFLFIINTNYLTIIFSNANLYTYLNNKIATLWTINEHYILIQLIFYLYIYIYISSLLNKKQTLNTLFFTIYNLLLLLLLINYVLIELNINIPTTLTNFNIILTHTLVSIHPPLILLSISFVRMLYLIFYTNFIYTIQCFNLIIQKYYLVIYYILTLSIILGSFWSINLFGWGGWWIWDPIENISFFFIGYLFYY